MKCESFSVYLRMSLLAFAEFQMFDDESSFLQFGGDDLFFETFLRASSGTSNRKKCLRLLSRFLRFAGRILPSASGRVPVHPQMYAMGAPHVRRECRPRYASAFHIRSPLSRRNVSPQLAPKFGGILNPPLPARPRMRGCESIFANSFVRPSPWRLQSDVYHSCSVSRGRAGFPPGANRQQH